jgi:hypothetical protein
LRSLSRGNLEEAQARYEACKAEQARNLAQLADLKIFAQTEDRIRWFSRFAASQHGLCSASLASSCYAFEEGVG